MSSPVGKCLTIHITSNSLGEAIRIYQPRRGPGLALPGRQMGSLVTLRRHAFPLVERWELNRFGLLPPLHTFRPADLSSLIARLSDGIKRDGVKPAFLLGEAEDMILNPIFQAEGQRPGLDCFGCECFFGFKKSRTAFLENLASQSMIRCSTSRIERAQRLNSCQSMY